MTNPSQDQQDMLAKEGLESKTRMQPGKDPVLSERDALLARMDEQIAAQRVEDDDTFLRSGDARAAMLAAEMRKEAAGKTIRADARKVADEEVSEVVEEQVDEAEDAAAAAVRVSTKGADPLAEYIVRENGKAMFKTVVDGKSYLIPVDKARAQLQKHMAADIRLQQAATRQAQLDARQKQIEATEAELLSRANRQPEATQITDEDLDRETTELVRSLVSRPEAEAAKQMASVLKSIRQAPRPQIDVNAIVSQAVSRAKQEIAAENDQRALSTGLEEFTKAYPDIAADSELFATADRKTTAIAQEHPEWGPGKVMLEAGKQTRQWLKSIGVAPPAATDPGLPNRRQEAKSKLTPMPASRVSRPTAADDANAEDNPADYLASLRKARGADF